MFCANCISEEGPFQREVQDGRPYIFCKKCLEAPAYLYDKHSFGVSISNGFDGVGTGNNRSPAYGIRSKS
jgi:hypothetical protein